MPHKSSGIFLSHSILRVYVGGDDKVVSPNRFCKDFEKLPNRLQSEIFLFFRLSFKASVQPIGVTPRIRIFEHTKENTKKLREAQASLKFSCSTLWRLTRWRGEAQRSTSTLVKMVKDKVFVPEWIVVVWVKAVKPTSVHKPSRRLNEPNHNGVVVSSHGYLTIYFFCLFYACR